MIKELDSDFDEIILRDSIELIVGMDLSFNSTGLTLVIIIVCFIITIILFN